MVGGAGAVWGRTASETKEDGRRQTKVSHDIQPESARPPEGCEYGICYQNTVPRIFRRTIFIRENVGSISREHLGIFLNTFFLPRESLLLSKIA